jgi:hypothetical protein
VHYFCYCRPFGSAFLLIIGICLIKQLINHSTALFCGNIVSPSWVEYFHMMSSLNQLMPLVDKNNIQCLEEYHSTFDSCDSVDLWLKFASGALLILAYGCTWCHVDPDHKWFWPLIILEPCYALFDPGVCGSWSLMDPEHYSLLVIIWSWWCMILVFFTFRISFSSQGQDLFCLPGSASCCSIS